jgi:hypothetical protein
LRERARDGLGVLLAIGFEQRPPSRRLDQLAALFRAARGARAAREAVRGHQARAGELRKPALDEARQEARGATISWKKDAPFFCSASRTAAASELSAPAPRAPCPK